VSAHTARGPADRILAIAACASAWACYLPLGIKYLTVLSCGLAAGWGLSRRGALHRPLITSTAVAIAALWAWLALSASWSPAPVAAIRAHLWQYSLLMLVPIIASRLPAPTARRALVHFAAASALLGVLILVNRTGWLPASPWLWHTSIDAEGNQRIANSILLALGSATALWLALSSAGTQRPIFAVAAALCVGGLALQDRRTGMLLLPVLLLVWAVTRQPNLLRRLAGVVLVAAAAGTAWQVSDGVRARFAEGLNEIQQYHSSDRVATSWGQRLRMWELTVDMVAERPVVGHGVASWQGLWVQRVPRDAALAINTTPHNEYLLVAEQAGAIGLGLLLWVFGSALRDACQRGRAGVPALLAWVAVVWTGLFNAVLRDAKFGLPLLLLAALGMALAHQAAPRPPDAQLDGR
jgi:O-antigen ligase